jgi:hypothetical protein
VCEWINTTFTENQHEAAEGLETPILLIYAINIDVQDWKEILKTPKTVWEVSSFRRPFYLFSKQPEEIQNVFENPLLTDIGVLMAEPLEDRPDAIKILH